MRTIFPLHLETEILGRRLRVADNATLTYRNSLRRCS